MKTLNLKKFVRMVSTIAFISLLLTACGKDNTTSRNPHAPGATTTANPATNSATNSITLNSILATFPCNGNSPKIPIVYRGVVQKSTDGTVNAMNMTNVMFAGAQYYQTGNSYVGNSGHNDIMIYTEYANNQAEIALYMCSDSNFRQGNPALQQLSIMGLVKKASSRCDVNEVSSAHVTFPMLGNLKVQFNPLDVTSGMNPQIIQVPGICQ